VRLELRKTPGLPEDSVPIRVVVMLAVELSIVAVVAQHAVDVFTAAAALLLAPLGYWFSYRRRAHTSLTVKLLLSLGLFAAMGQFLQAVGAVGSVDQARLPLAALFLWVQVLHAFDVPRRRDLAFSMVSSMILMAEAGALSLTTGFALFLVPWLGICGVWLYLSSRPRQDQVSAPVSLRRIVPEGARRRGATSASARAAAMPALAVIVAGFVLFLALPRVPGSFVKTPPFSFSHPPAELSAFDGGVTNPNLPAANPDGVIDFAPGAYPGLSDRVDLRARGHLSDDIAFRVRASQGALWRAEVFDTYDGTTWTIGDRETQTLPAGDAPGSFRLPPTQVGEGFAAIDTVRLTQTFYVDTPQPNVLFAAATPSSVYFPSGGLRVDRYGSVRTPILLDEGLVYSVISDVPVADPWLLQHVGREMPRGMERYLEVPVMLPDRVGELAARITQGSSTEYDQVLGVQTWIQQHTRYNLDAPPDPPGVDAVDQFLFVTRQGFCEQIASSMAVMLRTLGIPTRLVTGFGPGTRNPFTGYFEVKQSDAHAWLEVYYPDAGWVQYDPTFGVPEATPGVVSRFMAGPVFAAIGRFAQRVVPEPVKRAAGVVLGAVRDAARLALRTWPVGLVVIALGGFGVAMWRRRRGRPQRARPADAAEAAFLDLAAALAPAGHIRQDQATPAEYLRELERDPGLAPDVVEAAGKIVRTFERSRFAPESSRPSQEDVMRARALVAQVRETVGSR
jgi:transglutaminase-like putative cysteine protease